MSLQLDHEPGPGFALADHGVLERADHALPGAMNVSVHDCVAVKEFHVNYHNVDIQYMMWFLDDGNFLEIP